MFEGTTKNKLTYRVLYIWIGLDMDQKHFSKSKLNERK